MYRIFFFLILFSGGLLHGQTTADLLAAQELQAAELRKQLAATEADIEALKLTQVTEDLRAIGRPAGTVVEHSALHLSYDESHEQARWVAHIIRPEIIDGAVFRSNDFREDPLVRTGTAVEADYFLKYLQPDSTYRYDGFGYDRGHLAPSADFRWSAKALSESYFYSNMSPQRAEFNREGWAELERALRGYIYEHPGTQLYVVTGPVLKPGLPVIERSFNKVTIPEQYFKVALDLPRGRAIGFIMPNQKIEYPLAHYAVTVDEVESLTGLDFFNLAPNQEVFESSIDKSSWLPEVAAGNVEPIAAHSLPKGHYNTVMAQGQMKTGREVTVVGTVVSTRYSRSGNFWLNLDKKFPNQLFSVFIRKKDLVNFSYDLQTLEGKVIQ
ncbi:MAG: DNA/RNA non-specific endonuclease, partial [Bacteroidota bacterium]